MEPITRKKKTSTLVMANYNHAHYLSDSLSSIFSQSRPIDEVIVIDDASTDNSLEVLAQFQGFESRLKVLRNEMNRGVVYSANRGIAEAEGELICFHSADDFIMPTFFERSVGMLEAYPQAGLCTSFFSTVRDSDKEVFPGVLPWGDKPTYFTPRDLTNVEVAGGIPGHASIYDKQSVVAAGGLIPELKWHCDWFMNHVIAARKGFCFIPESLSFFRISEGGSYGSGRSNWREQKKVVGNILRLIFSDAFKDVIPFFQASVMMSHLYPDIGRFIVEEAAFLSHEEFVAVLGMLKEQEQQKIISVIGANKNLFPELHDVCVEYQSKLAS